MPVVGLRRDTTWSNFAGNLPRRPVRAHAGAGATGDAASFARAALTLAEAESLRVRAHGAAWSFSDAPYGEDLLLDLRPFQAIEAVDPADRLVLAEPGATLSQLAAWAEARGRSLPVTNGRGGLTIAGAISTGSHGAAVDRPPLGDYVRALGLAVASDRVVWVESEREPVLPPAFAADRGAELIRDDALLRAAQVGFGCFGVIVGVVLALDDAFDLDHRWRSVTLTPDLTRRLCALDTDVVGERPYHANLVLSPHRPARGRLSTATRLPATTPPSTVRPPGPAIPVGGLFQALLRHLPAAGPAVMDGLLALSTRPARRLGRLGAQFPPKVPRAHGVLSLEVAVDQADAAEALAVMQRALAERPGGFVHPGFLAVRWMCATRAPLGFTRFPRTTTLEIPTLGGVPGSEACFDRVFDALDRSGLTFAEHPGQVNRYDPARLAATFGPDLDRWRDARARLLGASAWRFTSGWSDRVGLT